MMTRRECIFSLLAGKVIAGKGGGGQLLAGEPIRPQLKHSFEDERFEALSADGQVLVLYASQTPVESYRLPAVGKSEKVGPTSRGNLRAIETGSRKQVQSLGLPSYPSGAAFLPVGQLLMFWYGVADDRAVVIWDTKEGRTSVLARGNDATGLWNVMPITSEHAVASSSRNEQVHVVRLTIPAGEVIGERRLKGIGAREMCFSEDRSLVACLTNGKDSELVILRTSDFEPVDKVPIPTNGRIWKIAFAGKDKLIVGAAINAREAGTRSPSLAFVHSIGKGGLGPHFPVDGLSAFTVSADAALLAVGSTATRRALFGEEGQARATLYNLRDGRVVGNAMHPWHREQRNNPWVNQLDRVAFSKDGKWMFTSTGKFETLMWTL